MPDITLCQNQTCPLRDNCKRGISYNDEKPNQSWAHFEPVGQRIDYWTDELDYSCEFQIIKAK